MGKRKSQKINEGFITLHDSLFWLFLKHKYNASLDQRKTQIDNNKNATKRNNNNNHVPVVVDERGPAMPEPMVQKIKAEMMNMNDNDDDNNNTSFMERVVWLGQKKLEETDTSKHHNRFFFPNTTNTKLSAFFNDEETQAVVIDNSNNKANKRRPADGRGMHVSVVDGRGAVYRHMTLKWWKSVNKIVFTREWNDYVEKRRLKPEVVSLQLWCFRDAQSKLCFAVNVVPTAPPDVASGSNQTNNVNGADVAKYI